MILCGWCGHPTGPGLCASCGRPAELPYTQRGTTPVGVSVPLPGRPVLAEADIRRRYVEAVHALRSEGRPVTLEALAERLDRSSRQVREWRKRFGL